MIFNFQEPISLCEKLKAINDYMVYQSEFINTFCQDGPSLFQSLPNDIKKRFTDNFSVCDKNNKLDEKKTIESVLSVIYLLLEEYKKNINGEEIMRFRQDHINCLFENTKILDNDPLIFDDLYYKTIKFTPKKIGIHSLENQYCEPFQLFPYDVGVIYKNLRIPQIGFFTKEFHYPAINKDNKQEWMTITPNEIYTMRKHINLAHGKVLTLGLGLGYYAFMVSEKESVESVTIVENNKDIIDLFTSEILPQFPHKEKIAIIKNDAFDYIKKLNDGEFDICFADIWDGNLDYIPYLKLKSICKRFQKMAMSYWVEETLIHSIKQTIIAQILYEGNKYLDISFDEQCFSNMESKTLFLFEYVKKMLETEIISTPENIDRLLKDDVIKEMLGKVNYNDVKININVN